MVVKITSRLEHRCHGCKWLRKPRPLETEGAYYCKNPRSPWYLRENQCKCDYKEGAQE